MTNTTEIYRKKVAQPVGYNASYLAEMLSAVDGESVELHLIEDRAASIKIDNDDSFAYVLMPMRL